MAATAEDQEHVVASAAKQEDSGWVAECLAGASRMQAPRWRIVAIMQASRQVEPHPLHRHLTGIAPRHGLLLGTIKSNDEMVGLVCGKADHRWRTSTRVPSVFTAHVWSWHAATTVAGPSSAGTSQCPTPLPPYLDSGDEPESGSSLIAFV